MRLCWGTVHAIIEATKTRQKLQVCLDADNTQTLQEESNSQDVHTLCDTIIAINYLSLSFAQKIGDRVLLNMTALDLGLGTGGVAFVVPTGEMRQTDDSNQHRGHIMKLRYTPLQREVLSIEEQSSPYHAIMHDALLLEGLPVVCCALASQVPLVAAAIRADLPEARIILCMTDEAALMYAFSDIFADTRSAGLIDTAITCGQAFGGDMEAITLHSGMLAAYHVFKADVCIVSIGPGTPGSATPYGHGGIAQGEALNAVIALGGTPIAPLRLSFADTRARHQGVSHHSLTTLGRICLGRVLIPLPTNLPLTQSTEVSQTLKRTGISERHTLVEVNLDSNRIDLRGVVVTTMGRTQTDDPAFFSASLAAGICAASIASARKQQSNR